MERHCNYHIIGGDTEAEKRMYARILLLKSVKMKKEIELPSPLETKRFFHQLVVCIRYLYDGILIIILYLEIFGAL